MKTFKLSVVVEKDEHGYFAFCPELQGCYAQGKTYEESMKNITDAIKLHIADRLASHEQVPRADMTSITMVEVAV